MPVILIVEDDDEIQGMMRTMLERLGYEVYRSANGVDALYQATAYKPDLIVLDLMMPWASGDAVLGFVRSTDSLKNTRVLVVSAHPDGASLAQQLEADAFLAKPIDMQIFCSYVERMLATT